MAIITTITQAHINKFTDANSQLFVNNVLAVDGTVFNTGDVLKAVADGSHEFYLIGGHTVSASYRTRTGGTVAFSVSEDFKTVTSGLANFGSGFSVATNLVTPDVKGVNDVYLITDAQVRAITQSRFVSGTGETFIDYGIYILGLIDLPFAVDPSMIVEKKVITLGSFNTGIEADLLSSDVIKLDMGSIGVTGLKNSLLDYKNTVALLHLPYCETVALEIDYVIDETVSIEYQINLYDGVVTVNVSSSKIGGVISTRNVDMGITIPFANLTTYPTANDPRNIKLGGDNGVKVPYIEIMRNNAILEDGFFTIPIIDESLLSGQTGFMKIEEVDLLTSATSSEKDLIKSHLMDGVIIR